MQRIGARELVDADGQPSGRWHVCYGGAPVCGCTNGESHPTRLEAEQHYYETLIAELTVDRDVHTSTSAHRCIVCDAWTPNYFQGKFYSWLGMKITHVCAEHVPDDDALRAFAREYDPFEPGRTIHVS